MRKQWVKGLVGPLLLWTVSPSLGLLLSGCSMPGKVDDAVDELANFGGLIDKAMDDIRNDNTRWQSIVRELGQKLPAEVQSTVRVEMEQLVARSIAKTGEEFRCNVDFMAARAIASLQRIKAMLLNKDANQVFEPVPPSFCQVTPEKLDMNLSAERRQTVDLSGYGFDSKDVTGQPLKVLLVGNSPSESVPLSEDRIGRTTHYHLVLNLAGEDMEKLMAQKGISKIKIAWGDKTEGFPEALIIPRALRTIVKEREPLGEMEYAPPHIEGDKDFNTDDDEPMSVRVIAETQHTDTQILTRVYMKAREERSDWTTAEGWSEPKVAFNAPAGFRIKSVSPVGQTIGQVSIGDRREHPIPHPQGEVAKSFLIYGDRKGDEAGSYTRAKVEFNPTTITLEEIAPPRT